MRGMVWRSDAWHSCVRSIVVAAVLGWDMLASAQQAPSAPSPAAAPTQQTATPRPPFPNRANEAMPSWLRVRGEFRERLEGFSGLGFVSSRNDTYWLSRFRFNATVTPSRRLALQVQAQDARVADKQVGTTGAPFKGTFDLRMAFADIGTAKSPLAARVGRQELAYGDQRLVGHVGWLNTARTFDAAKVTLRRKAVQLDLFAASVVRILDREFDRSGNGNRFIGAYATTGALVPQSTVEPYLFWRGDRGLKEEVGAVANLHAATFGVRWIGRLPARLDYNTEMATQAGSLGSDTIRAWAGHWQIRESYDGPHAVRISAEVNLASGDASATDGRRGTFDQLYPTPHDKYGLADQVGWKNIRHIRSGVEFSPGKKWQLGANYHSWWLMNAHDALYAAGGAVVARVASGAAATHVGQEIDLQCSRPIAPQLAITAGIAHVFPGGFLKQTTPGASYTAPFVMATYVFLADK